MRVLVAINTVLLVLLLAGVVYIGVQQSSTKTKVDRTACRVAHLEAGFAVQLANTQDTSIWSPGKPSLRGTAKPIAFRC